MAKRGDKVLHKCMKGLYMPELGYGFFVVSNCFHNSRTVKLCTNPLDLFIEIVAE